MKKFVVDENVKLTGTYLDEIYEKLDMDGELVIYRRKKRIDQDKEGIQLIRHGFCHVVQMRKSDRKGCIMIRCIKTEKVAKRLSIIVPLYNEENTAAVLLDKLINREWKYDVEFVIVESNSKDKTRSIALEYENRENVKLVLEDSPSGKGNAVLLGIEKATGNYYAIQDGDLEYDVNDYDKLLPYLFEDKKLFVLGSRYKKEDWRMRKFEGNGRALADYLNLGQVLLTGLVNICCGVHLTDPFTMYKLFHKDCMYGVNFKGGNFGLDWELVIRFLRKGYMPVEIPIFYKARSYEEGKHIDLIRTPIEGIRNLIHCRFTTSVYDYGDR